MFQSFFKIYLNQLSIALSYRHITQISYCPYYSAALPAPHLQDLWLFLLCDKYVISAICGLSCWINHLHYVERLWYMKTLFFCNMRLLLLQLVASNIWDLVASIMRCFNNCLNYVKLLLPQLVALAMGLLSCVVRVTFVVASVGRLCYVKLLSPQGSPPLWDL